MIGCSSSTPSRTTHDASIAESGAPDADAGADVPTYEASDFHSLHWDHYGTAGFREAYDFADCGLAAPTTSATLPKDDCDRLATRVVAPEVIAIVKEKVPSCTTATDDYANWNLSVGADMFVTTLSGCPDATPFKQLRTELDRMLALWGEPTAVDAGAD